MVHRSENMRRWWSENKLAYFSHFEYIFFNFFSLQEYIYSIWWINYAGKRHQSALMEVQRQWWISKPIWLALKLFSEWEDWCENGNTSTWTYCFRWNRFGSSSLASGISAEEVKDNETVTRCETFTTLSITALLLPETAFLNAVLFQEPIINKHC